MESQKVKEEARSNTLNPNSRCMTGHSNLNQPLNIYPAMNETFPTGSLMMLLTPFLSIIWILLLLWTIMNMIV